MTEINRKLPGVAVSVLLLVFLLFIQGMCLCRFICFQSNISCEESIQIQADSSAMVAVGQEEDSHHHPAQCVTDTQQAISSSKVSRLIPVTPIQADNQLALLEKYLFFRKLPPFQEKPRAPVKLLILLQSFRC